jgi:cytochrome c oxidase subunit 4
MADTHSTESHHGPTVQLYMSIFVALCVGTALSFVIFEVLHHSQILAAGLILLVAVVKATLVAMYFMHLKFDWSKLYFIVFPLMILTVMMIVVLLPDIVVGNYGWWIE